MMFGLSLKLASEKLQNCLVDFFQPNLKTVSIKQYLIPPRSFQNLFFLFFLNYVASLN